MVVTVCIERLPCCILCMHPFSSVGKLHRQPRLLPWPGVLYMLCVCACTPVPCRMRLGSFATHAPVALLCHMPSMCAGMCTVFLLCISRLARLAGPCCSMCMCTRTCCVVQCDATLLFKKTVMSHNCVITVLRFECCIDPGPSCCASPAHV